MFLAIVIFIIGLALLIIVHEFGHFIAARRAGAKIEEFGLGFPPRLFGVRRGETLYSCNLIPLGGFVRIFGEDEDGRQPRSFNSLSLSWRLTVVSAGVFMNFLFAAILFGLGAFLGMPAAADTDSDLKNVSIVITQVAKDSPAALADIRPGDSIIGLEARGEKIGFDKTLETGDIRAFTDRHLGEELSLFLKRGGATIEVKVIPRTDPPSGEGPVGFSMVKAGLKTTSWYLAPWEGLKTAVYTAKVIVVILGGLIYDIFATGAVDEGLTGPVGIAALTGQVAQLGVPYIINLFALISINLAIINFFPFPALDGGRMVFLVAEGLRGRPLGAGFERAAHNLGFIFLIILMIAITYRDVLRLL